MSSSDAAINYLAGGVNSGGDKVLGRQKAVELLYRGHIRQDGQRISALADRSEDEALFLRLVAEEGQNHRKIDIIRSWETDKLARVGAMMTLDPDLASYAWIRRGADDKAYSLIGLTHTLSSRAVIDLLNAYHLAPIQEWDGLVCTSQAAKSAVKRLLQHGADLYEERLGLRPSTKLYLPVIPLPVDCRQFESNDGHTQQAMDLRRRLAIGVDDCAFLYFGRFSFHAKAHPFPMFHGLQQAARQMNGRRVALLMAGQAYNARIMDVFRQAAAELCPDVAVHFLDGRDEALCQLAWRAADVFVSLPDNVQEIFGLTVVEAMAAGLPAIVGDWNGYRDTVIDGVTGLRIATVAPASGAGSDLARHYSSGELSYDRMAGYSAIGVAVDCQAFVQAARHMADDPARRRAMAIAARKIARERYDLPVIFTRYRHLWAELAQIRAASQRATGHRQLVPDPYAIFCDHPSRQLAESDRIVIAKPHAGQEAQRYVNQPLTAYARASLLPAVVLQQLVTWLTARVSATLAQIQEKFSEQPAPALLRSIGWLLKYDIARIVAPESASTQAPSEHQQGGVAFRAGDFSAAIDWLRQAVAIAPMHLTVRRNFLVALKAGNRLDAAEIVAEALIEDFPQSWQAHYEYARLAHKLKKYDSAEQHYQRAAALNSGNAEIYNGLGLTLHKKKHYDSAIKYLKKALSLDPNIQIFYINIGNIHLDRFEYDLAIKEYKKVLVLSPHDVGAHINLSAAYKRMGWLPEAERYLGKAVEMERDGGGASNNFAQLLLLQGKFTQGWQAYRWRIAGGMKDKTAVLPSIDSLEGKILHVRHEQGLGDEIFFLRFLPQAMARGITVRYLPQKKIASILRRTDLIGATVVEKFPDEAAGFCLNCGDLPLLLGHGDDDPLPPSLTVRPLAHKLEQAQRILAGPGPHIGVAWRGGKADAEGFLFKQASLDDLAAALHCYPGTIVILQRHPEPGEVARFQTLIGRPVIDASDCNDDLELMLALVDLLDDMAGVSNTNVHLRAMCGRESEVLIPNPPDFRWFDKGAVSPWFPHMRLYRQGHEGEWAFALSEMKAALIQRRGRRNEEVELSGDSDIELVRDEMRAGRFVKALAMCQTLIERYPGHPHVEMITGTCSMKLGRARQAIEHFQRAIIRKDGYVDALVNCGVACEKINKFNTALKYYIASLYLNPDVYQIHTNIGLVYQKLFDYDQAIAAHRRAVAFNPDYVDGQNNLASILLWLKRYDEAIEPLRHLTRLKPERPDYWEKLALALCETQAVDAALAALTEAKRLSPGRIENDVLEGYILMNARREVEAERIFRDVLAWHPSQISAKVYLLELLLQSGNGRAEADALLGSVWPARDQAGDAWLTLFNLLLAQDCLSEAETLVREEMDRGGERWQSPVTHLAGVYLASGKSEQADRLYADILARDPTNRAVQSTQALCYLAAGQWKKGWTRYLDRESVGDLVSFLSRDPLPADLSGLRILLGREQGIGDEVFFLRYAGELKRRGAWLGYVASPKMLALTSRLPFLDRVASSGREIPGCHRRIAIGDLPWLLAQFDDDSLPPSLALPARSDKIEAMRAILAAAGPPPYIGVAWQAGVRSRRALYKEIPRRPLAEALRSLPGTVICLQRLAPDHEMASFSEALGRAPALIPGIDDDLEAALALMTLLDELVGVSNTNVHLRALVGKPGRVLVPYPPDFRWMSRQGKSPWFPGMDTYRQNIGSNWDDVFDRLRRDLERLYLT